MRKGEILWRKIGDREAKDKLPPNLCKGVNENGTFTLIPKHKVKTFWIASSSVDVINFLLDIILPMLERLSTTHFSTIYSFEGPK
jgi:hypothetical protein